MRVVSFHVDADAHPHLRAASVDYVQLLDWMLRSVRRCHPEAMLTVLTDERTDLSALSVACERENHPVDRQRLMLARAQAQQRHLLSRFDDDVLFLDADMLMHRPMPELLSADCDIALTVRDDPLMPVNGGFLWVRSRRPAVVLDFFDAYLRCFR